MMTGYDRLKMERSRKLTLMAPIPKFLVDFKPSFCFVVSPVWVLLLPFWSHLLPWTATLCFRDRTLLSVQMLTQALLILASAESIRVSRNRATLLLLVLVAWNVYTPIEVNDWDSPNHFFVCVFIYCSSFSTKLTGVSLDTHIKTKPILLEIRVG